MEPSSALFPLFGSAGFLTTAEFLVRVSVDKLATAWKMQGVADLDTYVLTRAVDISVFLVLNALLVKTSDQEGLRLKLSTHVECMSLLGTTFKVQRLIAGCMAALKASSSVGKTFDILRATQANLVDGHRIFTELAGEEGMSRCLMDTSILQALVTQRKLAKGEQLTHVGSKARERMLRRTVKTRELHAVPGSRRPGCLNPACLTLEGVSENAMQTRLCSGCRSALSVSVSVMMAMAPEEQAEFVSRMRNSACIRQITKNITQEVDSAGDCKQAPANEFGDSFSQSGDRTMLHLFRQSAYDDTLSDSAKIEFVYGSFRYAIARVRRHLTCQKEGHMCHVPLARWEMIGHLLVEAAEESSALGLELVRVDSVVGTLLSSSGSQVGLDLVFLALHRREQLLIRDGHVHGHPDTDAHFQSFLRTTKTMRTLLINFGFFFPPRGSVRTAVKIHDTELSITRALLAHVQLLELIGPCQDSEEDMQAVKWWWCASGGTAHWKARVSELEGKTRMPLGGCHNPVCLSLEGVTEHMMATRPCGGCRRVRYCSRQCQVQDRAGHAGGCSSSPAHSGSSRG
ncbi:MAG: hypothetical protein WDW38_006398 [Sanguina aurantia]